MKKQISVYAKQKRERYAWHEKIMIIYCFVLIFLFLVTPLIKISNINSALWSESFILFNSVMTKTTILTLILIWLLVLWNGSYTFKNRFHRAFGYSGNDTMTNVFVLLWLLLMLYSIGETTALIKDQFSSLIGTTRWFLFLWLYIIGWIVWQLVVTRLRWKKQRIAHGVNIKHEVDESKKERSFQRVEKEFQWLFEDEEQSPSHWNKEDSNETHRVTDDNLWSSKT